MNKIIFTICFILGGQIIFLYPYTDDDLLTIIQKIRQEEELNQAQKHVLEEVWAKFTKGNITVYEDNLVFYYMRSVNEKQSQLKHPRVPEWSIYRKLSVNGYSLAAQHFVKNGFIHEFLPLKEGEAPPYHVWFPTEPNMVVYESGKSPYRRLLAYYFSLVDTKTLVLNTNDNYSPIFSPDGNYLLYLSDRDKALDTDQRVSLYARREQGRSPHEIRLTELLYIEPNTNEKRDAIVFIDDDQFTMFIDGKQNTFSLAKLVAEAETLRQKIAGNLSASGIVVGEQKNLLTRRILSETEINKGKVVIYEQNDNSISLELVQNQKELKRIVLMNKEEQKKAFGPLWLEGKEEIFFLKFAQERFEIWTLSLNEQQEKLVSRKYENCFGMALNRQDGLFAYIMERAASFFVFVHKWPDLKLIANYAVQQAEWKVNVPLLKFTEKELLYRARDGQYLPVSDNTGSPQVVNQKESVAIVGVPFFSAPYQLLAARIIKRPEKQASEQAADKMWSAQHVNIEINKMSTYISSVRNSKELDELRMRFNTLHEQVRLHQENTAGTEAVNKTSPPIIQRWIRELNRYKEAIGATEILLHEE